MPQQSKKKQQQQQQKTVACKRQLLLYLFSTPPAGWGWGAAPQGAARGGGEGWKGTSAEVPEHRGQKFPGLSSAWDLTPSAAGDRFGKGVEVPEEAVGVFPPRWPFP